MRVASSRTSKVQPASVQLGSAESVDVLTVSVAGSYSRTVTFCHCDGLVHTSSAVVPLVGSTGLAKKSPLALP